MTAAARTIQRVYLSLLFLHTLAASLIWGINTLFLLDAGLSNAGAFTANAFFTVGLVLFEVPTGVVADTRGRRTSYLLGTITLALSTALYLWMWRVHAPLWAWAVASVLLGLGFTFFSGAMQAWLVDAMRASGYDQAMEPVFAKGQIVEGAAMLSGSVAGGYIAQLTNLGVPYIIRALILVASFFLAFFLMKDLGFQPRRGGSVVSEVRNVLAQSIRHGLGNPPVRWVMLSEPFISGVSIYAFYAAQPYLLQLWGNEKAYGVAGLAAAVFAGAQIAGGLSVPLIRRVFRRRTTVFLCATTASTLILVALWALPFFWAAIALLALWGLLFAAMLPVRQSYLNDLVPSEQRATVLSFDSLLGSAGGVVTQPLLGRSADLWGYPVSYAISAGIQSLAIPILWIAKRFRIPQDSM